MPATSLEKRKLRTIEAIGADGLHPVQRAFMAEDALQCGFCTPGFVVEASAFHDRWREERGAVEPDRNTIARALAGHLCRCGAYEGIYTAVRRACAGAFDVDEGAAPSRRDAHEKVCGVARYTVDVREGGQLMGRILRSPRAHARVVRLDTSKAAAITGVQAIIEFPAARELRYAGQEIAAVAAVDRATADEARARRMRRSSIHGGQGFTGRHMRMRVLPFHCSGTATFGVHSRCSLQARVVLDEPSPTHARPMVGLSSPIPGKGRVTPVWSRTHASRVGRGGSSPCMPRLKQSRDWPTTSHTGGTSIAVTARTICRRRLWQQGGARSRDRRCGGAVSCGASSRWSGARSPRGIDRREVTVRRKISTLPWR